MSTKRRSDSLGPAKRQKTETSSITHPEHTLLEYPSTSASQSGRPVLFQQPTGLLTFSYTPQRALEFTNSALRYYIDPPPGADLRHGYDRWIKRPEERTRLDGLLKAVERVMQKVDTSMGPGSGKKWLRDISVVTWRGVMTKILTAPYEERDGCVLNAMLVDGTVYLEEHQSDAKLAEKEGLAPKQRQQMYYGYSFESWCTSSQPGIPERAHNRPVGWGGDVDTNVQWCSVVKTKLGNDRLVIGGEVDCVRDNFNGHTDTFVELKTSISIRGPRDEARFEKKLLKFYMQSFLLGVPEVIVGFRTPAGRLTTTQSFKTIQIPRLVRGKQGAWDPQVCLQWGQHFISTLKSSLAENFDIPGSGEASSPRLWRIVFTPKEGVKICLIQEEDVQEVQGDEDRVGFLPTWYFDQVAGTKPPQTPTRPPPHTVVESDSPSASSHRGWKI